MAFKRSGVRLPLAPPLQRRFRTKIYNDLYALIASQRANDTEAKTRGVKRSKCGVAFGCSPNQST
jgi:hypothetical protein